MSSFLKVSCPYPPSLFFFFLSDSLVDKTKIYTEDLTVQAIHMGSAPALWLVAAAVFIITPLRSAVKSL